LIRTILKPMQNLYRTTLGSTETFYVFLQQLDEQIIVFGHQEIDEMETLSNELLGLNQELNNLTRQLSLKNRELKRANEKILELSRTDSLTGCANRGFFNERISEMISLAKRKSLPLSVVMSDLDYFKKINDRFGHDAGDLVLKGYADLLRQYTRTEDLVARFGGEEFVVLLPLSDINEAFTMSERIRQALAKQDFLGNGYVVTVSCGVSRLKDEDRPEDLIKRADTAIYQAKDLGRNQTVVMDQK
jgi:diguanylate cyclase (GGDEF)-like protein